MHYNHASASGLANREVKCRHRDAGTEPERSDRRQTAGGSMRSFGLIQMHAREERAFLRNGTGTVVWGNRADPQPVKCSKKARWSRRIECFNLARVILSEIKLATVILLVGGQIY